MKHGDFILLDLVCLQLCYVFSYWLNVTIRTGVFDLNPYALYRYRYQAVVLFAAQVLVVLFSNNYHGIVRRRWFDEVLSVLVYIVEVLVIALVYLFVVHWIAHASRMLLGITAVLYLCLDFLLRQANKRRLRLRGTARRKRKRSMVLATSRELAPKAIRNLQAANIYRDYFISNVILLDGKRAKHYAAEQIEGVPAKPLDSEAVADLTHGWVDEVFVLQPDNAGFPTRLVKDLMKMGVTVSYAVAGAQGRGLSITSTGKIGPYVVLTSSVHEATIGQVMVKRIVDIVGGFVGCILTGIIFVIIAPIIYLKSPGPIFFVQERVGLNGKRFKMYKFRSMYMDAEERKAALQSQNQVDGLMFKVKNDPRIIGSERVNRHGKSCGIGNFIRRYSIDEFPQFFNVLKGDMSLVGTRPPTLDEWERYDLEHRVRMSIKPGITGLWQVSGRSKITNFEQVVELDREYIENWNLGLDVQILLKTVVVVVGGRGAL